MSAEKKYRYPGISSFETIDADIFFGRDQDRRALADRVEIEKSLLLYSRSGLGKSSLLKAALIPELEKRGFECFYIRLGLYQEGSLPPVQTTLRRSILASQKALPVTFLNKFLNRTSSLWQTFKSYQISQSPADRPIVLIFDQFEELASYPPGHLDDFKRQLTELLYTSLPKGYHKALKDETLLAEPLTEAELTELYKPLRVRVLFSIRSDQLNIINNLSDYLPNILKTYYELKPLTQQQAEYAIIKPARQEGAFVTPAFRYQPAAVTKILDSLASKKADEIDTAQLQILLQYVEKEIVEGRGDTDITADDLGELNTVYENYYLNSLRKLDVEQQAAQVLIEDKLIAEGRRVSYDKALCLQMVSRETLDKLIETRLLRQEPNTLGGYSYEVSHDSLVAPILKTRDERKLREQTERLNAQLQEARRKQKRRLVSMAIIVAMLVLSVVMGSLGWYYKGEAAESAKTSDRLAMESDSLAKIATAQRDMAKVALLNLEKANDATKDALTKAEEARKTAANAARSAIAAENKAKAERNKVVLEQAKTMSALNRARSEERQRLQAEWNQLKADERVYAKSGDVELVETTRQRQDVLQKQIRDLQQDLNP